MTLADRIVALLLETGALPACEIALVLRRRKMDVLDALHSDPRFIHTGKRKASRWSAANLPMASETFQRDSLTWPVDHEEGEEALVTLVREGRRSPEEALLLVVCAVNGAAA